MLYFWSQINQCVNMLRNSLVIVLFSNSSSRAKGYWKYECSAFRSQQQWNGGPTAGITPETASGLRQTNPFHSVCKSLIALKIGSRGSIHLISERKVIWVQVCFYYSLCKLNLVKQGMESCCMEGFHGLWLWLYMKANECVEKWRSSEEKQQGGCRDIMEGVCSMWTDNTQVVGLISSRGVLETLLPQSNPNMGYIFIFALAKWKVTF